MDQDPSPCLAIDATVPDRLPSPAASVVAQAGTSSDLLRGADDSSDS